MASSFTFRRFYIDWPLCAALALLSGAGLLILYSASGGSARLMEQQALRLGVAFAAMFVTAHISPFYLQRLAPWLYGLGLSLLVAVLAVGVTAKGGQRWLDLGLFRFQPAELMKLAAPMMVAAYLAERPLPPSWRATLAAAAMVVLPAALIFQQPDLGTALLVAASGGIVLFLAGLSWYLIGALLALLGAGAPFLWSMLHDYQRNRILTFLDPERDPLGAGYHIIQSKIAIGSGGLYGKGWLNGTQSHLNFLPERSTDFIFAVLGEEFGLTGAMVLLALYLFVILRGFYIASTAQDTFSRLFAGGLTFTLFTYAFVNIGMVCGLLPVVGLPLPFISYGGSSLLTLMVAMGMLMSLHTHRRFLPAMP